VRKAQKLANKHRRAVRQAAKKAQEEALSA
jgi:hypothetical protein